MSNFIKMGLAAGVFVASAIWILFFLGSDVQATSVDYTGKIGCGDAITVLRTKSGYQGGEYLSDQKQFDKECTESAKKELPPALAVTLAAIVSLGYFARCVRIGHHEAQRKRLSSSA